MQGFLSLCPIPAFHFRGDMMNIEQARTVAISVILDKLNFKPTSQTHSRIRYYSPLRHEKTPSFDVHPEKNVWYDHGLGKGGDIIAFVRLYLESQGNSSSVSDALRFIKNMGGYYPRIKPVAVKDFKEEDKTLIVRECVSLENKALLQYVQSRGISQGVARTYLEEARVYNTKSKRSFAALCLRNEDKGYELRNPFFKGCVGKKAIGFIRGTNPKTDGINIFEGFMDYLSMVEKNGKPFEDDAIILNSIACLDQATAYIRNYGYKTAFTWMDNDKAGKAATASWDEFLKTEESLCHVPMNGMYEPHKDVNAWHMRTLSL